MLLREPQPGEAVQDEPLEGELRRAQRHEGALHGVGGAGAHLRVQPHTVVL